MVKLGRSKWLRKISFFLSFLVLEFLSVSPAFAADCWKSSHLGNTYCGSETQLWTCKSRTTSGVTVYYWSKSNCASTQWCTGGSCVAKPAGCSGQGGYCDPSTSGCSTNWGELSGWCNNRSTPVCCKGCTSIGGVCKDSTNCTLYGGSILSIWCAAGTGSCCDEDGNLAAITCASSTACPSCYRCTNPGTINSDCERYYNSGTDGSCGGSNGQTVCSTDISATCGAGNATTASFDGYTWSWSCNGIKASSCAASVNNDSCTATKAADIDGVCGVSQGTSSCFAPTANLCSTGSPSAVSTNTSTNVFSWSCSKECSGTAPNCTSTRLVINGSCGAADGGNFTSTPTELCAVGTASAVAEPTTTSYTWSCNRNCNGNIDYCSAVHDLAPNLASTVLKNTSGIVIPVESGQRNHSCDVAFAGSKISNWTITAGDANGLADIKEISIQFRSANTYTYGPVAAVNGVASFNIDTTSFATGTYTVEALIDDKHAPNPANRGWLNTNRSFYVWDCEVKVDGTLYDNSDNLPCGNGDNLGFTKTIDKGLSFVFDYLDKTDNTTRDMTVVSPNFNDPKILTWQNTYSLTNETTSNYLGVFNRLKINDVCVSPVNIDILPRNYVDAYSASPRIKIQYSAIMDQEAWFRVNGGSVLAKIEAKNYVPITCTTTDCATSVGGLVWSKKVNLSGNDVGSTSQSQPQPPTKEYYSSLKYDFNIVKEIGTTLADPDKTSFVWPDDIGTTRGVIFVEGDLKINQNLQPIGDDYVFFVVKGKITIDQSVTRVNGLFYSDGVIEAMGKNDTQLKIGGSLYGRAGVNLSRSYVNKRTNNLAPSVEITYDPNLIFSLPKGFWETYENWTLE